MKRILITALVLTAALAVAGNALAAKSTEDLIAACVDGESLLRRAALRRLLELATESAEREQIINRIAQGMQSADTIEGVLQGALSELGDLLGASRGIVQISPLAGQLGRPHPVGRAAHVLERRHPCPHQIGDRLADRHPYHGRGIEEPLDRLLADGGGAAGGRCVAGGHHGDVGDGEVRLYRLHLVSVVDVTAGRAAQLGRQCAER